MDTLYVINIISSILIALCFGYHWFLVLLNFIKKPRTYPDADPKKYAVLISAKNEGNVLGQLLDSLKKQDYPSDLLDVYVVADNCTDNTADVARSYGVNVYERHNDTLKGKGFALNEIIHHIWDTVGQGVYDGYMVFDADNLVDKNFTKEINKAMSSGYKIATGYRNSKSCTSSWISYCYSMFWFRECIQMNRARNMLNLSANVTGTGYCVSEEILIKDGGFISKTLTEDVELTFRWIARGERVAFCNEAILYDEQPTKFSVSFFQRARWTKGNIQCYLRYGLKLIAGCFTKKARLCIDAISYILIPTIISVITLILNLIFGIPLYVSGELTINTLLITAGISLCSAYVYTMLFPLFAIMTERKHIHASIKKCVLYSVFYPIFMVTYVPIIVYAIFAKVGWKPIKHNETMTIEEMQQK